MKEKETSLNEMYKFCVSYQIIWQRIFLKSFIGFGFNLHVYYALKRLSNHEIQKEI